MTPEKGNEKHINSFPQNKGRQLADTVKDLTHRFDGREVGVHLRFREHLARPFLRKDKKGIPRLRVGFDQVIDDFKKDGVEVSTPKGERKKISTIEGAVRETLKRMRFLWISQQVWERNKDGIMEAWSEIWKEEKRKTEGRAKQGSGEGAKGSGAPQDEEELMRACVNKMKKREQEAGWRSSVEKEWEHMKEKYIEMARVMDQLRKNENVSGKDRTKALNMWEKKGAEEGKIPPFREFLLERLNDSHEKKTRLTEKGKKRIGGGIAEKYEFLKPEEQEEFHKRLFAWFNPERADGPEVDKKMGRKDLKFYLFGSARGIIRKFEELEPLYRSKFGAFSGTLKEDKTEKNTIFEEAMPLIQQLLGDKKSRLERLQRECREKGTEETFWDTLVAFKADINKAVQSSTKGHGIEKQRIKELYESLLEKGREKIKQSIQTLEELRKFLPLSQRYIGRKDGKLNLDFASYNNRLTATLSGRDWDKEIKLRESAMDFIPPALHKEALQCLEEIEKMKALVREYFLWNTVMIDLGIVKSLKNSENWIGNELPENKYALCLNNKDRKKRKKPPANIGKYLRRRV